MLGFSPNHGLDEVIQQSKKNMDNDFRINKSEPKKKEGRPKVTLFLPKSGILFSKRGNPGGNNVDDHSGNSG